MAHALIYHGKFERNYSRLKPASRTYRTIDGRLRPLPNTRVDGIRFGYMTRGKSEFVAVKADNVILRHPVRLVAKRHSDGKYHAPSPTTFGDRSARHLLDDMIAANKANRASLRALYARLHTSELAPTRSRSPGTGPRRVNTKYYNPDIEALEGNRRLETHLRLERSRTLADAKKKAVLDEANALRCEVCGFDFTESYRGLAPFCEIHHRRPLQDNTAPTYTTLRGLAVLCSNCHRAIHRTRPLMTVAKFRSKVWRGAYHALGVDKGTSLSFVDTST